MKKLILKLVTVLSLTLGLNFTYGQSISPMIFGQNAWMPDSIGNVNYGGKLHKLWGAVGASGATVVRFGGISPDKNKPTNYQYVKMIDSIRSKGMEPIMQVPFNNGQYNAQTAADIVKFINVTKAKGVKYWIIGNEPNLAYGYTNSTQVATYLKAYARAMKAVDPTIQTIGPEVAWYDRNIINGLTTPGGPDDVTGKDENGRYYIDIITFHTYPFKGTQTRGQVITNLTQSGGFESNLDELSKRIDACNQFHGRTGASAVKFGVTEANVDYQNPAGDDLNGTGSNSFVGGQFWAEMMGIAMKKGLFLFNFWSVTEGLEIGYINHSNLTKKPAYYHFQMMAKNFSGTYANSTDNQANVKVFASKNASTVSVMILNQDQASNFNYTVNLTAGAVVSGNNNLKINVDAGIAKEYTDAIDNQSTVVLVFNKAGELMKKIEYKLNGHADANKAPTVYNYQTNTTTTTDQDTTKTVTAVNDGANSEVVKNRAYPNPMKGNFTIEVKTDKANAKLEMYNTVGQLVYKKQLTPENGVVKQKIDLSSNMASGMYVVQVKEGENELYTTKMMLAK